MKNCLNVLFHGKTFIQKIRNKEKKRIHNKLKKSGVNIVKKITVCLTIVIYVSRLYYCLLLIHNRYWYHRYTFASLCIIYPFTPFSISPTFHFFSLRSLSLTFLFCLQIAVMAAKYQLFSNEVLQMKTKCITINLNTKVSWQYYLLWKETILIRSSPPTKG